MNETELLKGKTAIVTGSSSGIGRATAELLGQHGVHVYLVGRTQSALEEVNNSIAQGGGTASVAQIDINEKGRIAALVQQALDETKRLDIMVNNAGLEYPGSIIDGEMDKWREMVDTNILALLAGWGQSDAQLRRPRSHRERVFSICSTTEFRSLWCHQTRG